MFKSKIWSCEKWDKLLLSAQGSTLIRNAKFLLFYKVRQLVNLNQKEFYNLKLICLVNNLSQVGQLTHLMPCTMVFTFDPFSFKPQLVHILVISHETWCIQKTPSLAFQTNHYFESPFSLVDPTIGWLAQCCPATSAAQAVLTIFHVTLDCSSLSLGP